MADDSKMTSLADLIKSISEGKFEFKGKNIDPGFIMEMPDPYEDMSEEEKEMRKAINKIMTDRFTVEPEEEDIPEWLKEARKKFYERFYKAGGGMMNMDEMIRPIGMAGGGDWNDKLELEIIKIESTIKGLMEDEVLRGVDNSKEIQGNQNWLDYYRSLK